MGELDDGLIKHLPIGQAITHLTLVWADLADTERPTVPPAVAERREAYYLPPTVEERPPRPAKKPRKAVTQGPAPAKPRGAPRPSVKPLPEPAEYYIGISDDFIKDTAHLDMNLQGRILVALGHISRAPDTPQGNTVRPLVGDLKGFWRYPIGDWRLIYLTDKVNHRVTLVTIDSRGDVYG